MRIIILCDKQSQLKTILDKQQSTQIQMYYKRWTRMHLRPGLKYFQRYGVLNPQLDRYTHLLQTEQPPPLQHVRKHNPTGKTHLDAQLINQLFLKYPDLQYQPVSQQKFPGQPFNTFSYAYAFINQQKKYIRQGHTITSSFELTQKQYQQKMQRKLDQSLLSRGLAFGNRARSFLNVYQQQVQYESRLKTQRTQRELNKYDLKLNSIRQLVEGAGSTDDILDADLLEQDRIFYNISQNNRDVDNNEKVEAEGFKQIPKNDSRDRVEFVNRIQKKFSYLFGQFYQHSAAKDRLQGLTDHEIIKQIQNSPSKIKRDLSQLVKYLQARKIKVSVQNGDVVVSGPDSENILKSIRNNKHLKVALLTEALNYEKPVYSSVSKMTSSADEAKYIFMQKAALRQTKPQSLTKEQKQAVQINKKKDLNLVADDSLFLNKESYKIFQTQEERILRLEIKYYDLLISSIGSKKEEASQEPSQAEKQEQLVASRADAVQKFRRLKFRLERRYQNDSADQFLFPEHEEQGNSLHFESKEEYEDLLGYLRKKNDDRRLTSLEQSKDTKINKIIRVLKLSEGVIPEGTPSQSQ